MLFSQFIDLELLFLLPGIDPEQLKIMMDGNQKGLLGMFNVFAGGAVSRMAIFALGNYALHFVINNCSIVLQVFLIILKI